MRFVEKLGPGSRHFITSKNLLPSRLRFTCVKILGSVLLLLVFIREMSRYWRWPTKQYMANIIKTNYFYCHDIAEILARAKQASISLGKNNNNYYSFIPSRQRLGTSKIYYLIKKSITFFINTYLISILIMLNNFCVQLFQGVFFYINWVIIVLLLTRKLLSELNQLLLILK